MFLRPKKDRWDYCCKQNNYYKKIPENSMLLRKVLTFGTGVTLRFEHCKYRSHLGEAVDGEAARDKKIILTNMGKIERTSTFFVIVPYSRWDVQWTESVMNPY